MVKSNLFINYLFLIIFLLNNCFSQEKIVKSVSISGAPSNDNKIVFFNKENLDLMGWETKDIYQNLIQTFLSDININIDVEEKIFSILKYTN